MPPNHDALQKASASRCLISPCVTGVFVWCAGVNALDILITRSRAMRWPCLPTTVRCKGLRLPLLDKLAFDGRARRGELGGFVARCWRPLIPSSTPWPGCMAAAARPILSSTPWPGCMAAAFSRIACPAVLERRCPMPPFARVPLARAGSGSSGGAGLSERAGV